MKRWTVLLIACSLAACTAVPVTHTDGRYFRDRQFAAPSERISAADVFALSDEMKGYLSTEINEQARVKGRQKALIEALYHRGQLKLEYDSEKTRNAREAFAARSGNCLSLVIMTAAMAKALDLTIRYQKVSVDDVWARIGDLYLAVGHVNLTLGRSDIDGLGIGFRVRNRPYENEAVTIDFLPGRDLRSVRTQEIGEAAIVSMYMNNRAVEALARGRVDDAYWWVRESIVQSPGFLVPYNTLGAIYVRHGDLAGAERTFAHVLDQEPDNTQAMSNLIPVLDALGRTEAAQRLAAALARIEPEPPFSHFKRGMAAMRAGDPKSARDAFLQELARSPDYHEFHFWLGIAYLNIGDAPAARKHLELAKQNSTTRRDHDLYAAKLDRIGKTRGNVLEN